MALSTVRARALLFSLQSLPARIALGCGLVCLPCSTAFGQSVSPQAEQLFFRANAANDLLQKISLLENAVRVAPDYVAARVELSRVLIARKQYRRGLLQLDTALNYQRNHPTIWLNKGVAHLKLGEYPAALQSFERAQKYGGESAELYLYRGEAYFASEAFTEAFRAFEQALDQANRKSQTESAAEAWAFKGRVWQAQNDTARAIASYKTALALQPELDEARANLARLERPRNLEAWYEAAEAAMARGDWREARNNYQKLINANPGYKDAAVKLARAQNKLNAERLLADAAQLRQQRKFSEARAKLQEALRGDEERKIEIARALQQVAQEESLAGSTATSPPSGNPASTSPEQKPAIKDSSTLRGRESPKQAQPKNQPEEETQTLPGLWLVGGGVGLLTLILVVMLLQRRRAKAQTPEQQLSPARPAQRPRTPAPVSSQPRKVSLFAKPLRPGMEIPPPKLERYRIDLELGRGGMGCVYKAHDLKLERPVALKLIRIDNVIDGHEITERIARFRREAKATARLNHPNIVSLYDYDEIDGMLYMTMEYVEGETVEELLIQKKRFPIAEAVRMMQQACSALDYAHRQGIMHRDLKPSNMMLNEEGAVKMVDFGVAKMLGALKTQLHTMTGVRIGSPYYMSPEQIEAQELDGRTDIYALGAVFYEMLAGTRPFESKEGGNLSSLFHAILNSAPPKLSAQRAEVSLYLAAIIEKMLAKDRNQRFQSGKEIVAALEANPR